MPPKIELGKRGVFEFSSGIVNCEASEIGLPPGVWPERLPTTVGNGQAFVRGGADPDFVMYRQPGTEIRLVIYND